MDVGVKLSRPSTRRVPDALLAKTRERKEDATATHLSDPGKRFHKRSLFDLVRRDRVITKRTFSTIHPSNVERSERRVKQLSGGLMKNAHGVLSVLIASAAVLGGASIARADDHKVTANVPFDFMVGGSRMPAGHYMITTVGDNTAMVAIASVIRVAGMVIAMEFMTYGKIAVVAPFPNNTVL